MILVSWISPIHSSRCSNHTLLLIKNFPFCECKVLISYIVKHKVVICWTNSRFDNKLKTSYSIRLLVREEWNCTWQFWWHVETHIVRVSWSLRQLSGKLESTKWPIKPDKLHNELEFKVISVKKMQINRDKSNLLPSGQGINFANIVLNICQVYLWSARIHHS